MTVTVELHPASEIMPPEFRRWRVMIDGKQNSVHPTEASANAAADQARKAIGARWTPARGNASSVGTAKDDWRRR